MGLFLRAPGMTVQFYFLVGLDWGWVSVLPKAGLQRAADVLLEVNVHNSQTLQERADFLFTFHKVGTVQNWATFA